MICARRGSFSCRFSPLLIFGVGPFPALGDAGAGRGAWCLFYAAGASVLALVYRCQVAIWHNCRIWRVCAGRCSANILGVGRRAPRLRHCRRTRSSRSATALVGHIGRAWCRSRIWHRRAAGIFVDTAGVRPRRSTGVQWLVPRHRCRPGADSSAPHRLPSAAPSLSTVTEDRGRCRSCLATGLWIGAVQRRSDA